MEITWFVPEWEFDREEFPPSAAVKNRVERGPRTWVIPVIEEIAEVRWNDGELVVVFPDGNMVELTGGQSAEITP